MYRGCWYRGGKTRHGTSVSPGQHGIHPVTQTTGQIVYQQFVSGGCLGVLPEVVRQRLATERLPEPIAAWHLVPVGVRLDQFDEIRRQDNTAGRLRTVYPGNAECIGDTAIL